MTRTVQRVMFGLLLMFLGAATLLAEGNKAIVITRVTTDLTTHTITIAGVNFLGGNGKTQPTVLLEKTAMPILGVPTSTQLNVQLPFDPMPGTYLLTVSTGPGDN